MSSYLQVDIVSHTAAQTLLSDTLGNAGAHAELCNHRGVHGGHAWGRQSRVQGGSHSRAKGR